MSINRSSLAVVPRRDGPPVGSQRGHGARVQDPEAEEVIELQSYAVHCPVESTLKCFMVSLKDLKETG